jgi:hypothetical protein
MNTLNEATPNYISCIKPNAVKQPKTFNAPMNLEQLTYSGIFEAVQIRKQGYPFRLTHQLFFCRYSHLISYLLRTNKSDRYRTAIANHPVAFEELAQLGAHGGAQGQHYKTNIVVLMNCLSILEPALMNQLELGLTMVLYRAPQHRWLEGTVYALLAGYLAPSILLICLGFSLVSLWCLCVLVCACVCLCVLVCACLFFLVLFCSFCVRSLPSLFAHFPLFPLFFLSPLSSLFFQNAVTKWRATTCCFFNA